MSERYTKATGFFLRHRLIEQLTLSFGSRLYLIFFHFCLDVSTPSPQTSHRASMSLSSPGTTAVCYQFSQSNISTSGVDHGANGFPTMSFVDPAPPTDNFESLNSGYPSLSVSPNDGETHPTQMCGENSEPGGIKSVVAGKSKKLGSAGQKKKTTEITGKPTEGCKQPKKLNGVVKSTLKAKKSDSSAMSDEAKLVINKLDDMKVSDLKAECKKRNLPVSGAQM